MAAAKVDSRAVQTPGFQKKTGQKLSAADTEEKLTITPGHKENGKFP